MKITTDETKDWFRVYIKSVKGDDIFVERKRGAHDWNEPPTIFWEDHPNDDVESVVAFNICLSVAIEIARKLKDAPYLLMDKAIQEYTAS